MRGRLLFGVLVCCYLLLLVPFTKSLANRPVVVKLGALPGPEVLRVVTGDQRHLVAQYAVVKVLFYYGTLVEKFRQKVVLKPEYGKMFSMLQTSSRLDPWNADVYYFTQAAFTWELGKVAEVNEMLEYGMRYRTWDYQLPYFAGFNAAYFLKDYATAARHFQKAAELSGNPLFANLTARYFHEAGEAELGLQFLAFMQRRTTDSKMVALYQLRKDALVAVLTIQKGVEEYRRRFGKAPEQLAQLTASGVLPSLPADPYGGTFYLDRDGAVRSTSKFSFAPPAGRANPKQQEIQR